MRDIKFRAWDKAKNEWIAEGFHLMGEVMLGGLLFENRSIEQWNDIVIEQFSGLKDKNGIDIYEGDILRCCDCWSFHHPGFTTIEVKAWANERDHKAGWNIFNASPDGPEIIGNIHETPELLK